MENIKKIREGVDLEPFPEDEKPWRPDEGELPGQENSAEPEAGAADEALEEVLGGSDQSDEATDDSVDDASPQLDAVEDDTIDQEMAEQPDLEISSKSVVEAVLFSADEPVTPNKLADIVGVGGVKEVREIVEELNTKYESMDCAFRIESIAGGFQMLTLPEYNVWLTKLIKVRGETKLSPAALETLAIIAYKQPMMRVDIESVRGVAVGEMVRQLIDKGLVKIVGRAEELGRPLLYGTTRKFLETFGLGSLKDLPTAEDLKKPL